MGFWPLLSFFLSFFLSADLRASVLEELEPKLPASWVEYNHPLKNLPRVGGKLPIFELKNSPLGKRYAVMDGSESEEAWSESNASGLVEFERKFMAPAERENLRQRKLGWSGGKEPKRTSRSEGKIGPSLRAKLARVSSVELLDVVIRAKVPNRPSIFAQMERALAEGLIETDADYQAIREEIVQEETRLNQEALMPLLADLRAEGVEVTSACDLSPCLVATLIPDNVSMIVGWDSIHRVDADTLNQPDQYFLTGIHIREGVQLDMFLALADPYDGEMTTGSSSDDLRFALIEWGDYNDEHVGFREDSGSGSRIAGRYVCDEYLCVSTSNFTFPQDDHATTIAGLVFGDLLDAQDADYTNTLDRKERSGYAGEAKGYLYADIGAASGFQISVNHVLARSPFPHIANLSWGTLNQNDDAYCLGQDAWSHAVNDLFEGGVLAVKSTGNNRVSLGSACSISAPGSAIGAFTVGATGPDPSTDGDSAYEGLLSDVRWDEVANYSGGAVDDEWQRSIVDMTSYGCRKYLFSRNSSPYEYDNENCGTSYSTATVSATALDFIDFYKTEKSNLVDDPGVLFSSLLLMGDRQSENGQAATGFDPLYGAGRLKLRHWGNVGMDSPYGWKLGWTCVENNETVTIDISGDDPVNSDLDDLTAVIYWFDRRHEAGDPYNDIDLSLVNAQTGTVYGSSESWGEEKERISASNIGGTPLSIEIHGYTVDNSGSYADDVCGANSEKVYYAIMYEDRARDDADGPSLVQSAPWGNSSVYRFDVTEGTSNAFPDSYGNEWLVEKDSSVELVSGIGLGKALKFDTTGIEKAKLDPDLLDGSKNFTVAFTVTTSQTGTGRVMLSAANSSADNEFFISMENGEIKVAFKGTGYQFDHTPINDASAYDIAINRDGSTISLYIDGVFADSASIGSTAALSVGTNGLWFGNDQDCLGGCFATNNQFLGVIDDLQFYRD